MTDDVFTLHAGTAPLVVSLPHIGRRIPSALAPAYVARAAAVEDTDWHLDRVYDFAKALGASVIAPRHSRYVVDLNRPPENTPMYPGANNTELCPTRFFTGEPLYAPARSPDAAQIATRLDDYWRPYHDALGAEIGRLKARHGHVVLWDGHSIKSSLPWLFEGRLPDLNLGTANGASCAGSLRAGLMGVLAAQDRFSHITDGRFKGGYITRHYGAPAAGVHAVQLEMCWSCYMEETPPYELDPERVAALEPLLRSLLQTCLDWRPAADASHASDTPDTPDV